MLGKDSDGSHSSSSIATSNSSSELPDGCSDDNLRIMFPNCTFLNENDASLHYSDGWIFSTSDPNGLVHTVHFTQNSGSSVSLTFNGLSPEEMLLTDTDIQTVCRLLYRRLRPSTVGIISTASLLFN